MKDRGSRIKDPASRIKDRGPRIKDQGSRIMDLCFGTNEHPRRDTDVILRLSNSTIKDLSFYTGVRWCSMLFDVCSMLFNVFYMFECVSMLFDGCSMCLNVSDYVLLFNVFQCVRIGEF